MDKIKKGYNNKSKTSIVTSTQTEPITSECNIFGRIKICDFHQKMLNILVDMERIYPELKDDDEDLVREELQESAKKKRMLKTMQEFEKIISSDTGKKLLENVIPSSFTEKFSKDIGTAKLSVSSDVDKTLEYKDYIEKNLIPLLYKGLVKIEKERPANAVNALAAFLARNNPQNLHFSYKN